MFRWLALCAVPGLAAPVNAADLTIATWGGAYEAAQEAAVIAPFAVRTGLSVETVSYAGGVAPILERADPEGWDVVDMLEDHALAACAAGALAPLDHAALLGHDAASDFAPAKFGPCSVPQNVYAVVAAFDDRAYPGLKPTEIEDFFDVETFPGKRAIARSPDGILEWAMMAEGVPPAQVYDLLSTERGLRLAFRRLDTIRDHIVWWEDAAEPAELLRDGEVAMASGYNGRFFAAAQDGAPISILWDGRLIGHSVWAIPAVSDAPDAARDFIAFSARPESMARLAERIPYGPARQSAFDRIGLNPVAGTPMRPHLPNAPHYDARALLLDSAWSANTAELRHRRFEAWLAEAP